MTGLKLTVAGALVGAASIDSTATTIVLLASAFGAIGYLVKKVLVPLITLLIASIQLVRAATRSHEVLATLPETLAELQSGQAAISERVEHLEALAGDTAEHTAAVTRELGVEHRRAPRRPRPA